MNDDMRIELTAEGTDRDYAAYLRLYICQDRNIKVAASNWKIGPLPMTAERCVLRFVNGDFTLPNGAVRSPDASWVSKARYDSLSPEEKRQFHSSVPRLRSRAALPSSDRLTVLQAKMDEYMVNGARLGWLLDPLEQRASIRISPRR